MKSEPREIRTPDPRIKSALLYLLSAIGSLKVLFCKSKLSENSCIFIIVGNFLYQEVFAKILKQVSHSSYTTDA